ncbi:MAG TPA: hypothetical protein VFE46_10075 [Pirellulales bacterium]|jgi:hypothetical protein|nr:hypothetical protein [Pirellulales bacterium]
MKSISSRAALALAVCGLWAGALSAEQPQNYAYRQAQVLPWHNGYYDPYWGEPIALVVPPNAEFQANYGWGVGGTRVSPIYHQFGRPFPGWYGNVPTGRFLPTPNWPSDTQQFGVYYVRGPW